MRTLQLAAIALIVVGAVAAGFTIRQLVEATAAGPEPIGPAPVLIGNAPPPVSATSPPAPTFTVELAAASATPTLAPGTTPESEPQAEGVADDSVEPAIAPGDIPASVRIPRMGIQAEVVPVGLNDRGEMASPESFFQVGWWQHGVIPGDTGRAVLAGHIDSPDGEAIFYGLDRLAPGDEIFVASQDGGAEQRFVVSGAALYHVDHAPLDQIFGPSVERELILITCGGEFDHSTGVYLYRQVVFATLAQ